MENRKIKCSNCGCKNFQPTSLGNILATHGQITAIAYRCEKCNHIELFAPENDLQTAQTQTKSKITLIE